MSRPAAAVAAREQERVACPSAMTVQAPHCPMPQPNFVPFIRSLSRRTQSNGSSSSTSTFTEAPLIFSKAIIAATPFLASVRRLRCRRRGGAFAMVRELSSSYPLP